MHVPALALRRKDRVPAVGAHRVHGAAEGVLPELSNHVGEPRGDLFEFRRLLPCALRRKLLLRKRPEIIPLVVHGGTFAARRGAEFGIHPLEAPLRLRESEIEFLLFRALFPDVRKLARRPSEDVGGEGHVPGPFAPFDGFTQSFRVHQPVFRSITHGVEFRKQALALPDERVAPLLVGAADVRKDLLRRPDGTEQSRDLFRKARRLISRRRCGTLRAENFLALAHIRLFRAHLFKRGGDSVRSARRKGVGPLHDALQPVAVARHALPLRHAVQRAEKTDEGFQPVAILSELLFNVVHSAGGVGRGDGDRFARVLRALYRLQAVAGVHGVHRRPLRRVQAGLLRRGGRDLARNVAHRVIDRSRARPHGKVAERGGIGDKRHLSFESFTALEFRLGLRDAGCCRGAGTVECRVDLLRRSLLFRGDQLAHPLVLAILYSAILHRRAYLGEGHRIVVARLFDHDLAVAHIRTHPVRKRRKPRDYLFRFLIVRRIELISLRSAHFFPSFPSSSGAASDLFILSKASRAFSLSSRSLAP